MANLAKALGSPKRIELLEALVHSEKTVEELALLSGMSVKLTSAHLKALRTANLVETKREGRHVRYRLYDPNVGAFLSALQCVTETHSKELYLLGEEMRSVEEHVVHLSPAELRRGIKDARFILIDVRLRDEYVNGHFPGARSIPVDQLKKEANNLSKQKRILVACRGLYCSTARSAVSYLRGLGYQADRLDEGPLEWRSQRTALKEGYDEEEAK